VGVEVTGAEGDVTTVADVDGVTIMLSVDESVSDGGMDGLDRDVDGDDSSISIGSLGSNSSPREINSSSSSGLSAAFSLESGPVADAEGVGVIVGFAVTAGGGVSVLGSGTIIGAAGCLGVRRRRVSRPSSNSSYFPLCARCC
jgi:hypothetical protein